MTPPALHRLGLREAVAAMADGSVAAGDYLDACLARAATMERTVGAFAHLDPAAARRAADSRVIGPLTGIPIGIKDIIATADMPTEMGSDAFRGHVPRRSAWVVDTLRIAGAVVVGKTVTTEFAWRRPGKTRNPWNPAHTPGGSSSGSAAAVAYGAVPGALGTQTLGSVLRPAAFCGVVGFKPSFGAIPRTGIHPFASSLDHVGVFARNVGDAALLASVLVGRDDGDAVEPASPMRSRTTGIGGPPRIGLLRTAAWARASDAQRTLVGSVAARLADGGATVTAVVLPPEFAVLWEIAGRLCDAEGGAVHAALVDTAADRIGAPTIELVERGRKISAFDYLQAKATQRALTSAFRAWVASFDAVLTAPALGEAPAGLADTGDAVFCTPATFVGAPAIAVPAGFGPLGLPLGIQLIGAPGDDRGLLDAAAWVEREIAWQAGFPPD